MHACMIYHSITAFIENSTKVKLVPLSTSDLVDKKGGGGTS
jgi:hypothetical protein